ncbi:MAG: GreA/GreB family elongation factor [Lentimicrobium sp.]|nr:GreA/GreB family elongation factor [Lentimicrobium sp.]
MSRAFVNEDDQREAPFVPPRADLPDGVPNYVTPAGMDDLLKEKEMLLAKLKELTNGDDHDKANAITIVNTQLQMLENRISSAQVILKESASDIEIRFGSTIRLQIGDENKNQKFQIVGVDEADIKLSKIAFTSPLARILMHKKAGESVILKLSNGERRFKVISIE